MPEDVAPCGRNIFGGARYIPWEFRVCTCGLFLGILLGSAPFAVAQTGASTETSSGAAAVQERYDLIDIDTLFFVENRGLRRIILDLNGHKFKLASDADEVRQSSNAFLIPEYGRLTVNIAAFIRKGDENYIDIVPHGPLGTDAFILIGDLLVPGEQVAYAITGLVELPVAFSMLQGYPNPFHEHVEITFEIPEAQVDGVPIQLAIYNAQGQLVKVLINDRRYPGRFSIGWESHAAASGVYFCRLIGPGMRETMNLIHMR